MPHYFNNIDQESSYFKKSNFWQPDNPETLMEICLTYVIENFDSLFFLPGGENDELYKVNPETCLPSPIFDHLLKKSLKMCRPLPLKSILSCLAGPYKFPVQNLNLSSYPELMDSDLKLILSCHQLTHLEVNSNHLSSASVKTIQETALSLVSLKVKEKCKSIYSGFIQNGQGFPLKLSYLRCLALPSPALNVPMYPIEPLIDLSWCSKKLTVLDLSDSNLAPTFGTYFELLSNLQVLSLHNIPALTDPGWIFPSISKIKTLRKLDLGRSDKEEAFSYIFDVTPAMTKLIEELENLEWLEICGTNLAGLQVDVRPLSERMNSKKRLLAVEWLPAHRHLNYLGLMNCVDDPCSWDDVPADRISGDNDVEQILTSLESYVDRLLLLLNTLNALFELLKSEQLNEIQQARALEHTLRAMDRHRNARDIQLSGSASIFYLIKGNLKTRMTVRIKRHVVRAVLDAMEKSLTLSESNMLRNGCLILCHFKIPQDLLYDYPRVVHLLLRIVEHPEPQNTEPFVHRVSLNLLNSMACQVDKREKLLVGELGTFDVMLKVIGRKLEGNVCDEIMEVAWSLMWNATDETAPNCERFITEGGLEMFMKCYKIFNMKGELLRNMMGLMGNIAEVDYLKPYLITDVFIPTFRDLLDSDFDGIEVSYNSCGILANLMFSGPSTWGDLACYWPSVQEKMRQAMAKWSITSERNINYRSFGPILRLLGCKEVFEVQQWALWALCNLTKVYRSKYCPLLKEENGVDKLIEVFIETRYRLIRKMAAKVIRRCNRYQSDPEAVSDTEDDADDFKTAATASDDFEDWGSGDCSSFEGSSNPSKKAKISENWNTTSQR